jgi:hypothetical protein
MVRIDEAGRSDISSRGNSTWLCHPAIRQRSVDEPELVLLALAQKGICRPLASSRPPEAPSLSFTGLIRSRSPASDRPPSGRSAGLRRLLSPRGLTSAAGRRKCRRSATTTHPRRAPRGRGAHRSNLAHRQFTNVTESATLGHRVAHARWHAALLERT